jgi:hypothetical protein
MRRHGIPVKTAGVVAVVVLSLAAGLANGGSAATSADAATTGSKTFTDGTGDVQGTAPDVATVVFGDDPTSGTITVTVTAVGYGSLPAESFPMIKVYVDADKNPSTGSANQGGAEYTLACARDPEGSGWWIQRWEGSKYVQAAQSATMSFTRSGDTMTWMVNKSDIGVSTGMSFYVWSSSWDASDNQTGEDVAPDDGFWVFDLSTPPPPPAPYTPPAAVLKAVIGAPTGMPSKPVAGKQFTIAFPVTRSDNGAVLRQGTMICDPSVAGKVLRHTEQFKAGNARLSFAVPRGTKGKALKVKVTIKVGTQSTTRVASFRIG